jgi:prophage regulatory protein
MRYDLAPFGVQPTPSHQLESYAQLEKRIGLSRSTLYAMRKRDDDRYDPTFPEPVPVGPPSNPYASVRFIVAEVDAWVESRKRMRQNEREALALHYRDELPNASSPDKSISLCIAHPRYSGH